MADPIDTSLESTLALADATAKSAGYSPDEVASFKAWVALDARRSVDASPGTPKADPKATVDAALSFFETTGAKDKVGNPKAVITALNGEAVSSSVAVDFSRDVATFRGVAPADAITGKQSTATAAFQGGVQGLNDAIVNVLKAINPAYQSTQDYQNQVVASRKEFDTGLATVLKSIEANYQGASDELLAKLEKDVKLKGQMNANMAAYLPGDKYAELASRYMAEGDKALATGDKIAKLQEVGFFDNPVQYLANQFELYPKVATYNTAIKQRDIAQTQIAGALDNVNKRNVSDIAAAQLINEDQTRALMQQKLASAMFAAGNVGMDAAKVHVTLSGTAQDAAARLLGIEQLPLELQLKQLQALATGDSQAFQREARITAQEEKQAGQLLAKSVLDVYGIASTPENAKATLARFTMSKEGKEAAANAIGGTRGGNISEVLDNVGKFGNGLLAKDPNQAKILTAVAQIKADIMPTIEKTVDWKAANTAREQHFVISREVNRKLQIMQQDLSIGGESNIYAGITPKVFFSEGEIPNMYTPKVSQEFKALMQNAVRLGTIGDDPKTLNTNLVHTIWAGIKAGQYPNDKTTFVNDLMSYYKSVTLLTNASIGVHENQLPAMPGYSVAIATSSDAERRATPAAFLNALAGKKASAIMPVQFNNRGDVEYLYTRLIKDNRPTTYFGSDSGFGIHN